MCTACQERNAMLLGDRTVSGIKINTDSKYDSLKKRVKRLEQLIKIPNNSRPKKIE